MTSMTGIAPSTETELKFSLDPADIAAFKASPCLANATRSETRLVATYFDTEDHALHRTGFSLRLRRAGDRITQTLKGASTGTAGLFARPETERVLEGEAIDETMLAAALPGALYLVVSGRLLPAFTVTIERTEWSVEESGAVIGVSLDQGWIEAAGQCEAVNEVEFELHQGKIDAAFQLAGDIVRRIPLQLEVMAKSARGYRLLGAEASPPEAKPASGAETPSSEAIGALTASLLAASAVERERVVARGDEAAVHRLRVELRRLLSLIAIARKAMAPRKLGRTARTIRRAFKRLGRVRDLDILASAVPQNAEAAEAALVRIGEARSAALARARELLVSRKFAAAMLHLLGIAAGVVPTKSGKSAAVAPMAEEARTLLARRWRVVKRSPAPTELTAHARHALRIRTKTLRYTTDFFGEFYTSDRSLKRLVKFDALMRRLQDLLGALNDRRNMERLARHHLGTAEAAALGLDAADRPSGESLAAADRAHAKLVRLKPYWH